MQNNCLVCNYPLSENFLFCPICGAKRNTSLKISAVKQLGIYALSVFLPPMGLFPGIKYLLSNNESAKKIGAVALVLTLISTIVTIWISVGLINNLNHAVNSQLNNYNNLGF